MEKTDEKLSKAKVLVLVDLFSRCAACYSPYSYDCVCLQNLPHKAESRTRCIDQRGGVMSRKRPAQDEPPQEQEEDIMEPTRQLMYELASARQALLNHAAAINDCLRVTDHLAQLLTAAQRGVQTRTSMLSDEQASLLALRHACQMVSQQQQLSM